jgi:preprotein translocase subunit SecG|tara:strand:- start:550 stop:876 length:327 start_codon:yes stop_codon:yes gene_type:complete
MQEILLIIHVAICLALVGLVLLQHGKGASMGALFGSDSGNAFAAPESANNMLKLTAWCAAAFFASCLLLGYASLSKTPTQKTIINTERFVLPDDVKADSEKSAAGVKK